jgi:hypothetical protein
MCAQILRCLKSKYLSFFPARKGFPLRRDRRYMCRLVYSKFKDDVQRGHEQRILFIFIFYIGLWIKIVR